MSSTYYALEKYKYAYVCIRLSKKFLSFCKEIIDAQHFSFYIILLNHCSIGTKWIIRNSIKEYKTKNLVHLLCPYKMKETFGAT